MRKYLVCIAGWALGVTLGWLAISKIGWRAAAGSLGAVDWSIVVLAVGAVVYGGYLHAMRWKLLLPGEKVSAGRLFLIRSTGAGMNSLSPVRVLGEMTQLALLTRRDGIGRAKIIASLVVSGMMDALVTLAIVAAGLSFIPQIASYRPVVLGLFGAVAAGFLCLPLAARWLAFVPIVRRFRALHEAVEALQVACRRKRELAMGLALTAAG